MYQIVIISHVLIAIALVALVLIQHGKGASIGAAFGSGASQTVFGSAGAGSFLVKVTVTLAGIFFVTSILLSNIATKQVNQQQELKIPVSNSIGDHTSTENKTTTLSEEINQPS